MAPDEDAKDLLAEVKGKAPTQPDDAKLAGDLVLHVRIGKVEVDPNDWDIEWEGLWGMSDVTLANQIIRTSFDDRMQEQYRALERV
jgi:hypothetical protein